MIECELCHGVALFHTSNYETRLIHKLGNCSICCKEDRVMSLLGNVSNSVKSLREKDMLYEFELFLCENDAMKIYLSQYNVYENHEND